MNSNFCDDVVPLRVHVDFRNEIKENERKWDETKRKKRKLNAM